MEINNVSLTLNYENIVIDYINSILNNVISTNINTTDINMVLLENFLTKNNIINKNKKFYIKYMNSNLCEKITYFCENNLSRFIYMFEIVFICFLIALKFS